MAPGQGGGAEPARRRRPRRRPRWRELVAVAARTARGVIHDRVPKLAAEVAFFALLSLPPALLAVLGTVGYVAGALGEETVARIEMRILQAAGAFLTPSTVDEIVRPTVRNLLREGRADVISLSVVLGLWSASRATSAAIDTMRIAYGTTERPPSWRTRLLGLAITVAISAGVVFVLPVLVAGPRLMAAVLPFGERLAAVARLLYWPVVAVLGVGLLAAFYHFALRRRTPWRRDVPGAVLALVLWVLGGLAVRVYAEWTIETRSTYGSLSAPLVLLLWLYVTGLAVLIGAELNAEVERAWPAREAPLRRVRSDGDVFVVTFEPKASR